MITGAPRSQVDQVWNAFWSGGIANPLTVIEQITYLLFTKRLDELQTVRKRRANRLRTPVEDPIFSAEQQPLRWSRFKDMEAAQMFELFRNQVFPFIRNLHNGRESAYSRFMKDAVFVIPTPLLLQRVVTMLDAIPMEDRDTKGNLYEYMLSKIATAGIVKLMSREAKWGG
jgi:type I restriction enzyme M protein